MRFPLLSTRVLLFAVTTLLTAVPLASAGDPSTAAPMDWPYWRGPEMNGISREKGLVDKWTPKGENLLWKRDDLGSRSTPIVMNGKLYTILRHKPETPFEGERVVCLDAASGDTIWEQSFNVYLSDVPDTRVGWSSVTGDPKTGNVFALGVCGYFACYNGETGEILWDHSLSEEFGLLSTYGGRTNFPIVYEDLVIVSSIVIGWGDMAKPAHRFIAFDKRNGQPVWFEGTRLLPYDTTYSAPVLAVINGQTQLIFGSGDGGIHGFQPRTGKTLWSYNVSYRGINTSPVVVGNKVFAGHSEENRDSTQMGALFAIDASKTGDISKTGELWRHKEWFVGKSSPLYVDGRIYAAEDTGTLLIVDAETGKEIATEKLRGPVRNSPLYADGKIYICTENSIWWTLKPSAEGVEVVHRARLGAGDCYASPIVSHGRMYVATTDALYCIGKTDQQPAADDRPALPAETPVAQDQTPAYVQVVPVESLLKPAEQMDYSVRLYNANGQYLKIADNAEFSIDGPGSINAKGQYFSPIESNEHTATFVNVRVGELKGQARIRLVPPLPWTFNFDSGEVPISWVGARYRHIGLDYAFLTSLKERDARAADMYIWLHTEFTNGATTKLSFDNSNPRRQQWNNMLIFFALDGAEVRPSTLEDAKKEFDPSLQMLVDEKYLAKWEWAEDEKTGVKLSVERGPRSEVGNGVVVKIRTIPLGTKSQGWMGHIDLHDYTVQTDVMAMARGGRLPDMGIIAQRYTFDIMGASQQLQIRTWPPQLRMAQTVPFTWKSDVWYTMKLQASIEGDKAVLRGKVWVRGEEEPKAWMVEATDVSPNLTGSPGVFGNARDGEVFYDNMKVFEN